MVSCLTKIIKYLAEGITFSHILLWSDGTAKHFKNKSAMTFMSSFDTVFDATAEWHFNESYHGKGAMDGIGAVVKHKFSLLTTIHSIFCL